MTVEVVNLNTTDAELRIAALEHECEQLRQLHQAAVAGLLNTLARMDERLQRLEVRRAEEEDNLHG